MVDRVIYLFVRAVQLLLISRRVFYFFFFFIRVPTKRSDANFVILIFRALLATSSNIP